MNNKIKKRFMNRLVFQLIICLVFVSNLAIGQVGIGTTSPNASSILDLSSPNKGILIPRTDTLAVVNPAKGLIICDTSTSTGLNYFYYNGVYWQSLGKNAGSFTDSFYGDRTVKRPGIPNINVGTKTNVADFLNAYFFPFLSATIGINGNLLYEIGTSNVINISGSTTLMDETSFSNGHVDQIFPLPQTTIYSFGPATSYNTNTFTFTPLGAVSSTWEYRFVAYQNVANNGTPIIINSSTKFVQAVFPFLYGVSSANLTTGGTATYSGLLTGKLIQAKSNKTVSLTGTTGYIYFCYPAIYGNLINILDHNLFPQFGSFTKFTVNVTSVGLVNNWTTSYNIYQGNNVTSPVGWNYQFIFN